MCGVSDNGRRGGLAEGRLLLAMFAPSTNLGELSQMRHAQRARAFGCIQPGCSSVSHESMTAAEQQRPRCSFSAELGCCSSAKVHGLETQVESLSLCVSE